MYCVCTSYVLCIYCVQDEYTMEPAPQPSNGLPGEKKSWMGRKPRVSACLCCFSQTTFVVVQRNTRQHTTDCLATSSCYDSKNSIFLCQSRLFVNSWYAGVTSALYRCTVLACQRESRLYAKISFVSVESCSENYLNSCCSMHPAVCRALSEQLCLECSVHAIISACWASLGIHCECIH